MKICNICSEEFTNINSYANHIRWKHNTRQYERFKCKYCNKEFAKCGINNHEPLCDLNPLKKRKCKQCGEFVFGYRKLFCNRSCSTTYNNTHKNFGTRRSKLEVWLEEKLISEYPNLEFNFNKKDVIKSELDIFIPQLNIAFEINGVYHYKNIHGPALLQRIQNNDLLKQKACKEKNIILYSIDTSMLSSFNEKAAIPFFNIIKEIINKF
jgi:hypothetical protein